MSRLRLFAFLPALLSGCGTASQPPPSASTCEAAGLVNVVPEGPSPHVSTCMETCGNGLNPPTGGPHCAQTVACRIFDVAQPDCQWIHNLEHGHAVLLYNCPGGCPETISALRTIWEEAGADKRIIVTPWPPLQKKVAAVVWGWSWSGDEVDRAAIDCVLARQDEAAPEAGLACAQ